MISGLLIPSMGLAEAPQLITDVRLVDGRGDLGVHDLLIADGLIAAIDPVTVPEGAVRRDGDGMTMLPGLIDSHVHIVMHPMRAWTGERSPEESDELLRRYLAGYLSFGVTTILDPGITAEQTRHIRAIAEAHGGPEIQVVGPLLGPDGGYPSQIIPELDGVQEREDIVMAMDSFDGLNSRGVKVTMENGQLQPIWPLFTRTEREFIIAEAAARDLPLYIHAMDRQMTRRALQMNPRVLVHASMNGGRRFAEKVHSSDVFVMSTLGIVAGLSWLQQDEFWDHPAVARTVPADQYALLRDPEIGLRTLQEAGLVYVPGLPQWLRPASIDAMARSLPRREAKAAAVIRSLKDAGVPLVLGSDAGGSPFVPFIVHGPATMMELLLLEEAGLSPLEVIQAATQTPAEMMGMAEQLGTLEIGKRADLIVVRGDPLTDLSTLMTPQWVVRAGELRSPEEWLSNGVP